MHACMAVTVITSDLNYMSGIRVGGLLRCWVGLVRSNGGIMGVGMTADLISLLRSVPYKNRQSINMCPLDHILRRASLA